jgi:N-acetylmuramate 1-kinase
MTQPIASVGASGGSNEPRPWLTLEPPPREIQPLTGDISPRRYFRVVLADGATAILANYPAEVRPACGRFLRTSAILEGAGVRVPRVLAGDCEEGWMLVEDLGLRTLGEWGRGRPWSETAGFFASALEIAERIARLPPAQLAGLNPVLDEELLARELAQTWDFFLEPQGLVSDAGLAADLRAALAALCAALGDEPPVPCHRDFMVRNLMPLPDGTLAVLDHQDLRLGPPLYDIASLFNDTLFPPAEAEEEMLAAVAGSGPDRVRYHRAAAQRTLKAVGTFAKFAHLGSDRHLPLIGPTLAQFVKHFARIPEGSAIAARLRAAWSPVWQAPRRP